MSRIVTALHKDTFTALQSIQRAKAGDKDRLIGLLSNHRCKDEDEQNLADALLLILLDMSQPLHEAI